MKVLFSSFESKSIKTTYKNYLLANDFTTLDYDYQAIPICIIKEY